MTLKILAIDDIRDNLTVLKAVIEDAFPKAAVYTALNGKDGIELASTVDPDVILLDIIMPGMDGFEVCHRIKQNEQLRHIPVVFLTALKTSAGARIKALEAGVDGFLSKPVDREELIAEIRAMVKIKAAEERKKTEKEQLEKMVAKRTAELEEEIKLRISTELELRESEEKYRTIFKTIPSAAAISKLDSTYVDVNEGFTIISGYTKEEVVGKTATGLGIWVKPERRNKLITKLKSNRHVDNMEALFRCKDGSLKTGLMSSNLITIQGEPYILSITHDITHRKKMEQQLFENKERYRSLIDDVLDTSAVGVFIIDARFRVVWINQATERYFGIERKDVIGIDNKKLVTSQIKFQFEDPEQFAAKALATYEDNTYVENFICHMLPGKNREDRWLEHWSQPIRTGLYKGGRIEHYTDITRQVKTEDQLKESRERYKLVSGLTSDYVFDNEILTNSSIGKVWMAGSFEAMTGYPPSEFEKMKGWREMLHPEDIPIDNEARKKLFNNQNATIEVRIFHKNGQTLWVRVSAMPVWDKENNRLKKIIGSVKNITEEKTHRLLQEILFGVTKKILTAKSLPVLFAAVQQEMNKVMDARNFMVAQWEESTQTCTAKFVMDEKQHFKKFSAKGTLSLKIIKQKKPLFLLKKDILKLAEKGEINPKDIIPEVWMGTPLFQKERVYGLMIVQYYQNPGVYDKQSFQILEAVANELSVYLSRKETEEENTRLSRAVQQNPISILITDPEGKVEFVNPAFCETSGYSKEEMLGKVPRILNGGYQTQEYYKEIWDTILRGKTWRGEFHNKKKNGELYWTNAAISPLFDDKGDIMWLVATQEDITEKKRSQQFQEIQFNIAHSMVTSTSLNELFLTVKNELNKIIYAKNFSIALYDSQTNSLTALFGEDEEGFVKNIPPERSLSGRVVKAGEPMLFTRREIKKLADKGVIDLVGKRSEAWLGAPLTIKDKILGVIFVQSYDNPDAYDEKAVEIMGIIASQLSLYIKQKQTEEFNRKLSKAVEQSPAVIVITDTEGNIEYVNPKFMKIAGYTPQEALGQNPKILKSGDHDEAFYKELWDTVLAGKEWNGEFHNKKKNGELYWESALISPIFNDTGEITHLLGVKEDITEKKKMVAELIRAKDKAEESDRLKTAFLQNMSHEIRTPLNGILGFADLLTGDTTDIYEMKTYASYIKSSGNRLLTLINNILNLSRIEAGSIRIQAKPFVLNRLIVEVWQMFRIQSKKKNIQFRYHLPVSDEESIIISDEDKISQVVTNLLGNAFKFTSTGNIDLGYKISGSEIVFQVTDTGRGIPMEHQVRIFERFYQADISMSRDFEGAGLGLPISKGLVELLGGKMWLESDVGKGTSFYFSLPYNPSGKLTGQTKEVLSARSKKNNAVILIVEDDEASFIYLKTVLDLGKIKWLHAFNGLQAIEMCRKNPKIGLVLMDIKLPGINGLEATRKIKAFRLDLPVIAQTAHAFASDKMAAIEAGCDDFISKPIPKNDLLKIVTKYL